MSFKPVDPKVDFPKQEEEVLKFWQDNDIFKKSVSQREGAEDFVFYDGPPFATGLPHFGHFIFSIRLPHFFFNNIYTNSYYTKKKKVNTT